MKQERLEEIKRLYSRKGWEVARELVAEVERLKENNNKLHMLLRSLADYLETPWFSDWPSAQEKLSQIEAAMANLKDSEEK